MPSNGDDKAKSSVVQMERVETSHLRQADVIKTEGEGIQEYGETGAVVRCRDVGNQRDRPSTIGEDRNEDAEVDKGHFIEGSCKERKVKSRARCRTDKRKR